MTLYAATLSDYDEVLKTFYLPAVQEQLNHDTILADIIDTNETDVSGKNATIEMHYGRTRGIGARGDGEALPDADNQKFKTCTVPMKYQYGRIGVTGPNIAATRDDRGAYARALDTEITGVVTDMKKEGNRQMWGCGYGTLARWRSTESATSYTLQKKYTGNSAGGDGFGSTFGAKYMKEGRLNGTPIVLSAMSGSSGTYTVSGGTVDDIYSASGTISEGTTYDTIASVLEATSITETAGTFWVRPGTLGAHAENGGGRKEMMGIRGIVTDTALDVIACNSGSYTGGDLYSDNLQGMAIGTYDWFKAIVDSHSGGRYTAQRALTFTLMQKMFDKVEEAAGKDYGPNLILTTRAIRREYLELCQADRRYVNTMELDGGWTAIDYNGVPLTVDNDAIDGEVYFLTTKEMNIYRMSDYNWMQKDGAVLSRISGYDAYEAVLYRYAELGVTRRNTQGVLTDIDYED